MPTLWCFRKRPNRTIAALRQALEARYPYSVGDLGIVIFSKHPILAHGRVDRPGYPPWISLMVRWVRLDLNGTPFELAGVHLTRPFYPELQQEDVAALIQFVAGRTLPLVNGRRFQPEPVDRKAATLRAQLGAQHVPPDLADGAGQPASPAAGRHRPRVRLVVAEPRLGSDHRPLVADLALQPAGTE